MKDRIKKVGNTGEKGQAKDKCGKVDSQDKHQQKHQKVVWAVNKGVRPAIIEKQNARLICLGSVSEFSAFSNLAIVLSIILAPK